MRIQFYTDDDLSMKINEDVEKLGVNSNAIVIDILTRHYGLIPATKLSNVELRTKVFSEIEEFVKKKKDSEGFDINEASETYRKIEMVYAGKPSAIKAQIGKEFNRMVGKKPFEKVEQIFENGKPKLTISNRAAMYRVIN